MISQTICPIFYFYTVLYARTSDFQVRKSTNLASAIQWPQAQWDQNLNSKVLQSIRQIKKLLLTTLDCFIKNSDSY